ncbi:MAG TPA: gamma-glutamyltransferase [Candidatus Acidoferrum sp.]|nr:gamma-glutamyltransferase [Candidatus Acidoferrum sp.]
MPILDPAPLPPRKAVVKSPHGIVAAQSRLAAAAGAGVLAAGGNAVDAAVATGFATGVVEPWMNGLGGGGFMVVAKADGSPPQVVDFAMVAPAALDPADYPLAGGTAQALFSWPAVKEDRNLKGYHSIAVPGQVEGMRLALERFGTIGWQQALAPAIALAERGLPLDWYGTLSIAVGARELAEFPTAAAVYLPDGLPPVPPVEGKGYLPLGNLARTLRRLAEAGARDFYEGDVAAALLRDLQKGGNRISAADLRDYRAQVVPALDIRYRGVEVAAAPGLSGGPTLADVLGRLPSSLRDATLAAGPSAAAYAAYADAFARAYAVRLERLGAGAPAPSCTTHLSVVDRHGNMVALTQTLLSRFGSKVVLPETGILMNNGILWFDPRPGRPNSIAPGRRPLANMCPVVVRRDGAPWFALGASGGRRIMPAVAQILSFLVDYGMTLEEAFHQPRLDVSGEGRAILDDRLPVEVERAVAALMPVLREPTSVYPVQFACPSAVLRDPATGLHHGMGEIASPWAGAVAETG